MIALHREGSPEIRKGSPEIWEGSPEIRKAAKT